MEIGSEEKNMEDIRCQMHENVPNLRSLIYYYYYYDYDDYYRSYSMSMSMSITFFNVAKITNVITKSTEA